MMRKQAALRKNLPTATRGNLPGRASAPHVRLQITSNEGRDAKDARPSWHRRIQAFDAPRSLPKRSAAFLAKRAFPSVHTDRKEAP